MSAALPSPWSPQQRRWLQALGHVLLRPAAGDEAAQADVAAVMPASEVAIVPGPRPAQTTTAPLRRTAEPVGSAAPRELPPSLSPSGPDRAGEPSAAASGGRAGAMRRPAQMPDRLRLALLRASGLDPADAATMAVMAQWPVEHLRGDAAAKRALWPQLRALRKRPA